MSPLRAVETASTQLWLPAVLQHELSRFAQASYPLEACGLLVGRAGDTKIDTVRVVPARNLNLERPEDRYLLDPQDFLATDRAARAEGLEIVGIWHSHPDHPARPSGTDLESAWEGYSYLIISTTADGAAALRSWRLVGDRFVEEAVEQEDTEP
ncbi:MAG: M67 family metallopeptidase [Acidobacteria bacterium]|nr:M67 family metallopeptidase [Acidobacteriota bacterium]